MSVFLIQTILLILATFLMGLFIGAIIKLFRCRDLGMASDVMKAESIVGKEKVKSLKASAYTASADKLAAHSGDFVVDDTLAETVSSDSFIQLLGDKGKVGSLLARHGINNANDLLATPKKKLADILGDVDIDDLIAKVKQLK